MTKFITLGNWTLRIMRRKDTKPWFNFTKGRASLWWDTSTKETFGTVWEVNIGRLELTLIHYWRT